MPTKYTKDSPYTEKVLVMSTAHITEETDRQLAVAAVEGSALIVRDADPGWVIYCDEAKDKRLLADVRSEGFDPQLIELWRYAHSIGCSYLRLDPDAPVHEGFPTYEW